MRLVYKKKRGDLTVVTPLRSPGSLPEAPVESFDQKATTPSTMKPLILPPLRMSVAGKSLYFCVHPLAP